MAVQKILLFSIVLKATKVPEQSEIAGNSELVFLRHARDCLAYWSASQDAGTVTVTPASRAVLVHSLRGSDPIRFNGPCDPDEVPISGAKISVRLVQGAIGFGRMGG